MRLLDLLETNLYELVQHSSDGGDYPTVVAFRGHFWILPSNMENAGEEVLRDMANHVGIDMDAYDNDVTNMADSFDEILELRPDILYGTISGGNLHVRLESAGNMHPVTSSMMKKLVAQLGLNGVTTSEIGADYEDAEDTFSQRDMLGALPDKLFHGTHSGYLTKIAKIGLRPNVMPTNWDKIQHDDIIFGSAGYDGAVFHANRTTGGDMEMELSPEDDFPVIIEFQIPDKNLIVPDYDVASNVMGHNPTTDKLDYTNKGEGFGAWGNHDAVSTNNPEGRAWKAAGIFGYKGWIPPKYIVRVHTNWWEALNDMPQWSG
jgi:hypothetical protein